VDTGDTAKAQVLVHRTPGSIMAQPSLNRVFLDNWSGRWLNVGNSKPDSGGRGIWNTLGFGDATFSPVGAGSRGKG
jgi:hypothetical protein